MTTSTESGNVGQGDTKQSGARPAWIALVLALLAAVLAAMSGFGHRLGWWPFTAGFAILAVAASLAVVASVLALATLIWSGRSAGQRVVVTAALALAVSLPVFTVPLHWLYLADTLPPIHDITTDTRDPPEFVAILPLRRSAPDSSTYGGPRVALLQKRAYPYVRPAILQVSPVQAFRDALHVARSLGWHIVAAVPDAGRIEATDTTFWFGFTDDIVVRIRPQASGARVDLRSTSRVGVSDLGTNAHRIRAFLRALRKQLRRTESG